MSRRVLSVTAAALLATAATAFAASPHASLRAALPTAAQFGPAWGTTTQDNADVANFVVTYALTHCKPVAVYARAGGQLDGPAPDPGFVSLARQNTWVSLDNDPDLQRTGAYQAQAVTAYAQRASSGHGAALLSTDRARLTGCTELLLGHERATLKPATVTHPGGIDGFAAFSATTSAPHGPAQHSDVLLLRRRTTVVIVAVTDMGSPLGVKTDLHALRRLADKAARATARRLGSA